MAPLVRGHGLKGLAEAHTQEPRHRGYDPNAGEMQAVGLLNALEEFVLKVEEFLEFAGSIRTDDRLELGRRLQLHTHWRLEGTDEEEIHDPSVPERTAPRQPTCSARGHGPVQGPQVPLGGHVEMSETLADGPAIR